jgi:tetraacyldisaccharide 4'-kinase
VIQNKLMIKLVLQPLSTLWGFAYRVRRSFYEYGILKKSYFKVPIISVGNLTFGGTGKTPLIIWLIKKLEGYDCDPVILTRGYRGKLEKSSGIIKGGQKFLCNPYEFGDEPLLISKKMSRGAVIVGKRRAENLKKYFYQVEPDIVLLDDGFQHIQLYRSFNIVIFDALLPLESYKTAPLGYLREGLPALKDADVVLISRADQVTNEKLDGLLSMLHQHLNPAALIGRFKYVPIGIFDGFDKKVMELEELTGKSIIALTAIASPDSFYHLLEGHGATIVDKIVYPDHHFFSYDDINDILMSSVKNNAIVITSEKDMVKIRKVTKDPRIICVNIDIQFLSGEEQLLGKLRSILNLDYNIEKSEG